MLQPQQIWGHAEKLHPGLNGHIPGQEEQEQNVEVREERKEDGGVSVQGLGPARWLGAAGAEGRGSHKPESCFGAMESSVFCSIPYPTQSLLPLCPRTFGLL